MRLSFTVGLFDRDGDKYMDGIFIHLHRNIQDEYPVIIKIDTVSEAEDLAEQLLDIAKEIRRDELI